MNLTLNGSYISYLAQLLGNLRIEIQLDAKPHFRKILCSFTFHLQTKQESYFLSSNRY